MAFSKAAGCSLTPFALYATKVTIYSKKMPDFAVMYNQLVKKTYL